MVGPTHAKEEGIGEEYKYEKMEIMGRTFYCFPLNTEKRYLNNLFGLKYEYMSIKSPKTTYILDLIPIKITFSFFPGNWQKYTKVCLEIKPVRRIRI